MACSFTIDVEPDLDLVRITMSGFFTERDIQAFAQARTEAHRKLRCGLNRHLTINDLRGMKIQAKETVDTFREMLADPRYHSRQLAFVVGPTLTRGQLMRAIDRRFARCFDTVAQAEAWLLRGDGEAVPQRLAS